MTRTRIAALFATLVAGLAALVAVNGAGADTSDTAVPAAVTGTFTQRLTGTSTWTSSLDDQSLEVRYNATGLKPNRYWFTVIYGNTTCDPAQAFPVLIGRTDRQGRLSADVTVSTNGVSASGLVNGTGSVSTRWSDNANDRDGDGKVGYTDVVAVAGRPHVGLVECDGMPVHA